MGLPAAHNCYFCLSIIIHILHRLSRKQPTITKVNKQFVANLVVPGYWSLDRIKMLKRENITKSMDWHIMVKALDPVQSIQVFLRWPSVLFHQHPSSYSIFTFNTSKLSQSTSLDNRNDWCQSPQFSDPCIFSFLSTYNQNIHLSIFVLVLSTLPLCALTATNQRERTLLSHKNSNWYNTIT